jgi:hypothetical protein
MLALTGLITPTYNTGEKVQPVVIVGDGTLPGMGDLRGRQFCDSFFQVGAASPPTIGYIFQTDCVVEEVSIACNTAGTQGSVDWAGPSDAITATYAALAQTAIPLIDRNTSLVTAAPVTRWATNATALGTAAKLWYHIPAVANQITIRTFGSDGLFMGKGSTLFMWNNALASIIYFGIKGRTF